MMLPACCRRRHLMDFKLCGEPFMRAKAAQHRVAADAAPLRYAARLNTTVERNRSSQVDG